MMCSETSPPRLSFSHDLSEPQVSPNKKDHFPCIEKSSLHDSNSEFEFITSKTLEFESSSADELFSNGVILPIQIQEKTTTITRKHSTTHHHVEKSPYTKLPPRPSVEKSKKELLDVSNSSSDHHEKKSHSNKSFWGFNRSKSLNCDTKKNLVCSLPLLPRSNSTGSVTNPKKMSSNKQQLLGAKSSSSCSGLNNLYPVQKGTCSGKSYGNGLRISPILNVPTPCVSKESSNLFGLGSFLRIGKVKKGKK